MLKHAIKTLRNNKLKMLNFSTNNERTILGWFEQMMRFPNEGTLLKLAQAVAKEFDIQESFNDTF